MQIAARDAHVAMSGCIPNLSQRPPSGMSVANKRVAAVMDRQRFEARGDEDLASRAETIAKRVVRGISS
jgi:hypothetical protein